MPDPNAKRTPEVLIRLASSAKDRTEQLQFLDALVMQTYLGPQSMKTYQALATISTHLAFDFVMRMPDPVPKGVLLLAAQALPDRVNPLPLRLAVAGKLLGSLPDSNQAVGPIVRSMTAGLSRSRVLERMIQLQSRVDRCDTLDAMVAAAELRVKLNCPKCRVKLTRPELIVHLWHRHRLIFERGQALEPRPVIEKILTQITVYPSAKLPEDAFRATANYFPQSEPLQVLQAVAARQRSLGSIPRPLIEEANTAFHSLCPTCLAPLPDRIRPLPPPLAVTVNRLAGDSFSVQVWETASRQTVEVQTPELVRNLAPVTSRRWGPRGVAAIVAGQFLILFLLGFWFAPARIPPIGLTVLMALISWGIYAAVRFLQPKLSGASVRAFDVAWQEIAANLSPNTSSTRFLTRLCLSSVGRGTAVERTQHLQRLIEQTAERSEPTAPTIQLLAAAQALQTADGIEFGKDKVNDLVKLFEAVFLGELPIDYAEYLAEMATNHLQLNAGDAGRLSLRLLGVAFENNLLPQDILTLLNYLPWLRMVFGLPTLHQLQVACIIWRGKNSEPWANIGPAMTLFDLAKKSPLACRKILSFCPDALLKLELPEAAQRGLGDILLTPRGLLIGSSILSDPEVAIDLNRSPRGSGWNLKLGREIIPLDRKLPAELLPLITAWLNYRVKRVLPQAEALTRTNPLKVRLLLNPLATACSLCNAQSIGRTGQVGDPWPLDS